MFTRCMLNKGSVIPGDNPLLEIVPQDRIEVHLGVEQDDVDRLRPGTVGVTVFGEHISIS